MKAMKQAVCYILMLVLISSCRYTTGSGNIVSESRSTGDFSKISAGGPFEVIVKKGPSCQVRVEADDNIIKYIETRVSGSTLKIKTQGLHNFSSVHMIIYVTAPQVEAINASASASVKAEDILESNGQIAFNASSSGEIDAVVNAPAVEADVSSGATINISGRTREYRARASSGGEIRSWDLLSENTTVNSSSGASADVHASVNLDARASSGASVTYRGNASVKITESSGGSIHKKD